MVSLGIIETRKHEKLSTTKELSVVVLFLCVYAYKGARMGEGKSILQEMNSSILYAAVAIIAAACLITILVSFIIEQTKQQVQVGNLVFANSELQPIYSEPATPISYASIKNAYIQQSNSVTSSSLFQIMIYTEDDNYNFTCEILSLGTVRYLADYLRQQGVNCELSERNIQAEVAAAKAGRWL